MLVMKMALYEVVCGECGKKYYLNMSDVKNFINTGRKRICPECSKKMQIKPIGVPVDKAKAN